MMFWVGFFLLFFFNPAKLRKCHFKNSKGHFILYIFMTDVCCCMHGDWLFILVGL